MFNIMKNNNSENILKKSHREWLSNWGFLAPCLFVLILCAGWPLLKTIYFSFTDAELDNLNDFCFIGIDMLIS